MVKLDYQTNNPRWGWSGVKFSNWENFSFTLGYLSNLAHYTNMPPHFDEEDISIHLEHNDKQGAWDKEGRIHYYGSLHRLATNFNDLYACSSAGVGRITKRINSNGYILSLIKDFNFKIKTYVGYTTADVFPPSAEIVESKLRRYLMNEALDNLHINNCIDSFVDGYNL